MNRPALFRYLSVLTFTSLTACGSTPTVTLVPLGSGSYLDEIHGVKCTPQVVRKGLGCFRGCAPESLEAYCQYQGAGRFYAGSAAGLLFGVATVGDEQCPSIYGLRPRSIDQGPFVYRCSDPSQNPISNFWGSHYAYELVPTDYEVPPVPAP